MIEKLYSVWESQYDIGLVNRTTEGVSSQLYSKNERLYFYVFDGKSQRWERKNFEKSKGWLGVTLGENAIITAFPQPSPAQQAGLQVGDAIIEFDNRSVESSTNRLIEMIQRTPAGREVSVVVLRNSGKTHRFSVTLGVRP